MMSSASPGRAPSRIARASGPGRSAGGTVTLTPLGRLLAEAVFGSISPPAADTAEDLVTAVAWMPPAIALTAAGRWLAARAPHAAVRELLEFAAAFDGSVLRSVALEIARRRGADAMPVWGEYARMPGFGAYARQWLATQDEAVAADVLAGPGDRLRYTYDFGDEWDHDIKLEKVLPPDPDLHATAVPVCLAGKGACPPEDCGGPWGYAELKETIADLSDEEHERMLEWLGLEDPSDFDPAAFDLASVNARLQGSV
jgi:hypothetical protein